jgi:hypothetical protein
VDGGIIIEALRYYHNRNKAPISPAQIYYKSTDDPYSEVGLFYTPALLRKIIFAIENRLNGFVVTLVLM